MLSHITCRATAAAPVLRAHTSLVACRAPGLARVAPAPSLLRAQTSLAAGRLAPARCARSLAPGAARPPSRPLVTIARARPTWIASRSFNRPEVLGTAPARDVSGGPPRGAGRLAGLFGLATVAFGKMKYVLVALKLTKVAPVLSMVATSAAYSLIFGPAYGCGMVGLIFVHECGHVLAMRYYGIPFSPMVFVPFVGAMVQMKKFPADAVAGSVIALAGPVLGGAAAAATAAAGHALDSQLLMALGDWGFMINLFNLLPIGGLDGGHVGDALHPALPALGLAGGVGLAATGVVASPIFYLVLLGGAFQVGGRLLGFVDAAPAYKRLAGGPAAAVFAAYVALIGALVGGMAMNNVGRLSPRAIEAQMRGEKLDLPPGADGSSPYDDYFYDPSDDRDDDREWGAAPPRR